MLVPRVLEHPTRRATVATSKPIRIVVDLLPMAPLPVLIATAYEGPLETQLHLYSIVPAWVFHDLA